MVLLYPRAYKYAVPVIAALLMARPSTAATTPQSFDKIAALAQSARDQNKLDEALGYYRQALMLKPTWKEGLWYASTILYDQERYPDAATGFKRFLAIDPKSAGALALLGLSEFELKDYRASATHLEQARGLGVGNTTLAAATLYHYALLLTRFGQFEAGGQMLLTFAQGGHETPAVMDAAGLAGLRRAWLPSEVPSQDAAMIRLAGRAMCAAVEHRDPEAREEFGRLVKTYPKQPDVHYLRGSWLLTVDPEAALAEFKSELELNPQHVAALVAVAMGYLSLGDATKALPFAERAVKAGPQEVAAHAALGRVLTETGALDRAIQELQAAVKLAPDSPPVRITLASAYAKAGRSKEAAQERAEFLRLRKLNESPDTK
ncbi:MAG TPA: tetratricopeptide repeat protein [Bryobacteraceae bacterium]|jgi:tetratricopeptide (TPR) repeat protein